MFLLFLSKENSETGSKMKSVTSLRAEKHIVHLKGHLQGTV
jgi:hypothetical protein